MRKKADAMGLAAFKIKAIEMAPHIGELARKFLST
jgi:hypothetical protein